MKTCCHSDLIAMNTLNLMKNTIEKNPWPCPFEGFAKIPRLNRDVYVLEKIDGTNALVYVDDAGGIHAGSRTRWITPEDDNFGFASWVQEHAGELCGLGPGKHFGEWWGHGIQRNYGLQGRRFSLFHTSRWDVRVQEHNNAARTARGELTLPVSVPPDCCGVVSVLYIGPFSTEAFEAQLSRLRQHGSVAVPGFMQPEGVVVFQPASGRFFKVPLEDDGLPKGRGV